MPILNVDDAEEGVRSVERVFLNAPHKLGEYLEESRSKHDAFGPKNFSVVGAHLNHMALSAGMKLKIRDKEVDVPRFAWVKVSSFDNFEQVLAVFKARYPVPSLIH